MQSLKIDEYTDEQTEFFLGAAAIIKADLPDDLGNFALITHAIRYRMKGVETAFIECAIDELIMADDISLEHESNG